MLAITGSLRTSAMDSLNTQAHLLPAMLLVRKWCHHALTRMAMLPKEHPLHKHLNQHRMSKTKRHKGPIHHLLKWFKLNVNAIEKIPATTWDPSKIGKAPFKLSITNSRENSIKEIKNTPEEIQIYLDSLVVEGKVGAVAILTIKGRHTKTLHFHLRPDSEHIVHEAEMVGLLLGLHMLNSKKTREAPAMIDVDNQAAIKALVSDLRGPGHHLAPETICIVNSIEKKRKKKKKKGKAEITIQ